MDFEQEVKDVLRAAGGEMRYDELVAALDPRRVQGVWSIITRANNNGIHASLGRLDDGTMMTFIRLEESE